MLSRISLLIMVALWWGLDATHSAAQASTFPPTWTPTFTPTFTPVPSETPTSTATPSLTVTPEPTQTLTSSAICENFMLTGQPLDEITIGYLGASGFSWIGNPMDSVVIVSFVRDSTQEETLIPFLPDEGFNALVPMESLPTWGGYTWTVSLLMDAYGEICQFTGRLTRDPWWVNPVSNPLDPPFAR